jgi:hypothetical protein
MNQGSGNHINQYKLLFYFSWVILYFIFPAWRFYHINLPVVNEQVRLPLSSEFVLLIYFLIAAYVTNALLKSIYVDERIVPHVHGILQLIRNNSGLVIVCFTSAVLHVFTYLPVYAPSVRYSLWIYNFITNHWHLRFRFPIQYPIWLFLLCLLFLVKQKKLLNFMSGHINSLCTLYKSNLFVKFLFMVLLTGIFLSYTRLLPYYSGQDHALITGYPPLGTVLYVIGHLLFGIEHPYLGPLLIQLSFYILSGISLYGAINMFFGKGPALVGASIFLFSPLVFSYAGTAHLSSGVAFFIGSASYFFLKFIKYGKNRDLVLTAFLISTGSLYKHDIFLMLFICSTYLIYHKIKNKDLRLMASLGVLSLSVLSFIPLYLTAAKGDKTNFSHFTAFEGVFSNLSILLSQLSWPIFILLILSVIYIFFAPRKQLASFFGLVFISYYSLYTMMQQQSVHRYSMAFYPAISVFLALFIHGISEKVRWRHAFKIISSVLLIYLVVLCTIPRSSTRLVTFKYSDFEIQSFPADEAVEWILNNTRGDEKVLKVFLGGDATPLRRIKTVPQDKFVNLGLIKNIDDINNMFASGDTASFRQYLRDLCKKDKISYIVFPGGDALTMYPNKKYREMEIRKFLEEDRYDDFITVAKFNIDDNYIYVYKVRDGFVGKR